MVLLFVVICFLSLVTYKFHDYTVITFLPVADAAFTATTTTTITGRRRCPNSHHVVASTKDNVGRCPYLWKSKKESKALTISPILLQAINSNDDVDLDENYEEEDEDYDDDDDIEIKPYGSRSLAWTKRYRRLNPYEKVRNRVLQFGHRSKDDWDDACSSGQLGQYVPLRPDEMYAPEWISWDEFLGVTRSYNDTRNIAVNVLG